MNTKAALMVLSLLPLQAQALPDSACEARSGAKAGALLELYTSEGCSSCPPADHWFAGLAASADPLRLSLLAFHVDYWDELGWRDRFSQHAFTLRQGQRTASAGSRSIYTPQLMASEQLNLRWNQPASVLQAIDASQKQDATVDLHLRATPIARGWRVDLDTLAHPGVRDARVYLALYEDGVTSTVRAGENAGEMLHHERVVRGLWGGWPLAAKHLDVQPPTDASATKLGLAAFVQDAHGRTLQALSLPLRGCAAGR